MWAKKGKKMTKLPLVTLSLDEDSPNDVYAIHQKYSEKEKTHLFVNFKKMSAGENISFFLERKDDRIIIFNDPL